MMRIGRYLTRFFTQARGNVAVITALVIVPLSAAIGGGVDFAHIINAKARLQDAADSAAIAAALNSSGNLDSQKLTAQNAFAANLQGSELKTVATGVLAVKTISNVQTMNFEATAHVKTYMLGLAGINSMDISATANAGVSINAAEIVFVLDNTGSMAQNNKMTALKTSLTNTLNALLDSNGANTGKTKVALVPFDTQVALDNVGGMSDYAGSFTTVNPVYTCSGLAAGQCTSVIGNYSAMCTAKFSSSDLSECVSNQRTYTKTSNGRFYVFSVSYVTRGYGYYGYDYRVASSTSVYNIDGSNYTLRSGYPTMSYDSQNNSKYPYSLPDNNYSRYNGAIAYTTPTAGGYNSSSTVVFKDNNLITANDDLLGVGTSNWSGCVIDRYKDNAVGYDVTADAPVAANPNTLYPAARCATNSLLPIKDLTTDIAALRTYANGMKPAGNTNITIGIQWGMEVLSPTPPFTNAAAFGDTTINKYMIILTDGANTQNRWTTSQTEINKRTALACENAKKLGITVFTVGLEIGDSPLLRACASDVGYYYNLSSSTQINGALGGIMKSIKKIRLTR